MPLGQLDGTVNESVVDQLGRTIPVAGSGAGGNGWVTPAWSPEHDGRHETSRAPSPSYQPKR